MGRQKKTEEEKIEIPDDYASEDARGCAIFSMTELINYSKTLLEIADTVNVSSWGDTINKVFTILVHHDETVRLEMEVERMRRDLEFKQDKLLNIKKKLCTPEDRHCKGPFHRTCAYQGLKVEGQTFCSGCLEDIRKNPEAYK